MEQRDFDDFEKDMDEIEKEYQKEKERRISNDDQLERLKVD